MGRNGNAFDERNSGSAAGEAGGGDVALPDGAESGVGPDWVGTGWVGQCRVSQAGCTEGSWLWAVRTAVGTPVEELARRLGVQQREIFRLEQAERESRITLGSLERAAEAMD